MGRDSKYGYVITEFGTIPADEPVVVFRAQDRLVHYVLDSYDALCRAAGASEDHLSDIAEALDAVIEWQSQNLTKTPDPMGESADRGRPLRAILVSLSLADRHPGDVGDELLALARVLGLPQPRWSSKWERYVWPWEADRWLDRDDVSRDDGGES